MKACIDSHRPAASRGLALVTVLWVLVLLSLMAASFTATTRTEVNLTRNLVENAQAEALAEAGLARALLALLAGRRNIDLGDAVERLSPGLGGALETRPEVAPTARQAEAELAEPGAGEALLGPGAPGGAGEAWRADGTVYAWRFGGGTLRAAIQSEAGKIDLNAADEGLLRGLFLGALWTGPDGEPQGLDETRAAALVDALRDFADPDQLTRLNGAEDRNYRAAGLPWGAKDAAFERPRSRSTEAPRGSTRAWRRATCCWRSPAPRGPRARRQGPQKPQKPRSWTTTWRPGPRRRPARRRPFPARQAGRRRPAPGPTPSTPRRGCPAARCSHARRWCAWAAAASPIASKPGARAAASCSRWTPHPPHNKSPQRHRGTESQQKCSNHEAHQGFPVARIAR
jgi:hypothetical protein